MKNTLFVVLFAFITTMIFAQADSTNSNPAKGTPGATDSSQMAKIYVIRSTGHVGSAVNLRVFVDDAIFCKVRNNSYALFYVVPGTHMFSATSWDQLGKNDKFPLKVPVEAGKTYYMSLKITQRFVGIEITLEEITFNTAGPMLEKYKQDKCD